MSNVKPVLSCPHCNAPGKQKKDYGRIVAMECPVCGTRWSTLKLEGKK